MAIYIKGVTISRPLFWVSILVLGGVLIVIFWLIKHHHHFHHHQGSRIAPTPQPSFWSGNLSKDHHHFISFSSWNITTFRIIKDQLYGGVSKIFNFYPYLGRWWNLTCAYFSNGLVQPPTSQQTTKDQQAFEAIGVMMLSEGSPSKIIKDQQTSSSHPAILLRRSHWWKVATLPGLWP